MYDMMEDIGNYEASIVIATAEREQEYISNPPNLPQPVEVAVHMEETAQPALASMPSPGQAERKGRIS